jgi:hypothetical protein
VDVIIYGKGIIAGLFFHSVEKQLGYPKSSHIMLDLKWWQIDVRHELRIYDTSRQEMRQIENQIKDLKLAVTFTYY